MRSVFIKDFMTGWKTCKIIFILFLVYAAAAGFSGNLLWSSIGIAVAVMIPGILLEVDERGNWLKYLFCTAVSKKDYVREKYILSLLLGIGGYGIFFLFWVCGGALGAAGRVSTPVLSVAVAVFAALVVPGIALACAFCLGAIKGRIVMTVLVTLVCAAGGTLSGTSAHNPQLLLWLTQNEMRVSLLLICVSVLVFICSYFVSAVAIQRKEY